jgi:hypothetical protein
MARKFVPSNQKPRTQINAPNMPGYSPKTRLGRVTKTNKIAMEDIASEGVEAATLRPVIRRVELIIAIKDAIVWLV